MTTWNGLQWNHYSPLFRIRPTLEDWYLQGMRAEGYDNFMFFEKLIKGGRKAYEYTDTMGGHFLGGGSDYTSASSYSLGGGFYNGTGSSQR